MFDSPPTDWAEFRNRHGKWEARNTLINVIEQAISGREDDDK